MPRLHDAVDLTACATVVGDIIASQDMRPKSSSAHAIGAAPQGLHSVCKPSAVLYRVFLATHHSKDEGEVTMSSVSPRRPFYLCLSRNMPFHHFRDAELHF